MLFATTVSTVALIKPANLKLCHIIWGLASIPLSKLLLLLSAEMGCNYPVELHTNKKDWYSNIMSHNIFDKAHPTTSFFLLTEARANCRLNISSSLSLSCFFSLSISRTWSQCCWHVLCLFGPWLPSSGASLFFGDLMSSSRPPAVILRM